MKKALVIALMMVLGLTAFAFADGALTGKWTASTSFFPSATAFEDFVKSVSSTVEVDYTIGGWVFTSKSSLGLAGLTGQQFKASGTLGAFTLESTLKFMPMLLVSTSTTYTGGKYQTVSCGAFSGPGFTWTGKTVSKTYTAAFDDWTVKGSVSIAGVDFAGLFFLEGKDHYASYTGGSFHFDSTPTVSTDFGDSLTQTTSTVARSAGYGSGWKFSASGAVGDATLTALAYFNLSEPWYNSIMGLYGETHISDTFKKYGGYYSVVCNDCGMRFNEFDLILSGMSFGCVDFSAGLQITCAGFQWAKFLIEDISLGCCWDLNFDFLVTFSTLDKALSMEPEITIANSCFTIDAVVLKAATDTSEFEITGIDIRALGLTYTWNGVTFTAETSWDTTNHPILGTYGYITGPDKIYIWVPDMTFSTVTLDENGKVEDATYAIDSSGDGYWKLASYACEKAYAYEKFGITVDGDACCGGAYKVSAVTYFGDIKQLSDLDGTYYADTDWDGAYDDVKVVFYGDGSANSQPSNWSYSSATECGACCDVYSAPTLEKNDIDATYGSVKTANRLFNWVETDLDVSVAIGSNFTLKGGVDIAWFGWEDLTFGFEFTF